MNSEKLNPTRLTRMQLADVLTRSGITKLTPNAINGWLGAGCPRNSDRSYNVLHVCAWLAEKYGQTPYRPSATTDEAKKESIALQRERRLAVRQTRLMQKGLLVKKEEIEQEQQRRVHAVKSGLLSPEKSLAREIVGVPQAQAEAVIAERVQDLLNAYADGWNGQGEVPKETKAS
jgi:hypothetical protein